MTLSLLLCLGCTGPRTTDELLGHLVSTYRGVRTVPVHHAAQSAHSEQPTVVNTSLTIVKLGGVSQDTGTLQLTVWLNQQWRDPRLAFETSGGEDYTYSYAGSYDAGVNATAEPCWSGDHVLKVHGSPVGLFWTPGLYVTNLLDAPKHIESGYEIHPGGWVYWQQMQLWDVHCPFDFSEMPYDIQGCSVRVAPYMYHASEVQLGFINDEPPVEVIVDGGQTSTNMQRRSESTRAAWQVSTSTPSVAFIDSSSFQFVWSYLDFNIVLERDPQYYEDNFLMPMGILVGLCYMSFFVARAAVPARVAINAITFLAISGFTGVVLRSLPLFSGRVWLLEYCRLSLFFVAFSNLEYAAANMLMRSQARIEKATSAHARDIEASPGDGAGGATPPTAAAGVAVQVDGARPKLRAALWHKVGRFDRLLMRADGGMWVKDELLDICCRWLYLPAYLVAVAVLRSQLSGRPATS